MKIIADTHCHTIASSHAYSTLMENVHEAKAQGLYAIAITDHARTMPSPPGTWYFENFNVIPKSIEGVNVLRGIEANVLNSEGNLDLPDLKGKFKFDWIIASIHDIAFKGNKSFDECTKTWLKIAENPLVHVIGHSGLPDYLYDYEKVIPVFGEKGKLVEINNSSFKIRKGSHENCKKIAIICKKYKVPIVVNSDAHFCMQIGRFEKAIDMLEEIEFPEELIVNSSNERFNAYLNKDTCFFQDM